MKWKFRLNLPFSWLHTKLRDESYIYPLLILLIIIFHGINNHLVLVTDRVLPPGDPLGHCLTSFHRYSALREFDIDGFLKMEEYYPPLFTALPSLVYMVLGPSYYAGTMFNMFYLVVLLYSTYGLGKLLHSKSAGVLSAFLLSMFPAVFGFSRTFYIEFALLAAVTLSIYLMLRTEKFSSLKFSIFFGLGMASGMLIKWTYPLFIVGPFICYSLESIFAHSSADQQGKGRRILNLLLSLLICIGLITPFYYIHFKGDGTQMLPVVDTLETHRGEFYQGSGLFLKRDFNFYTLSFFLSALMKKQEGYILFTIFMMALLATVTKNNKIQPKQPETFLLLIWLFVPLMILTTIMLRYPAAGSARLSIPVLPPTALLIAIWVSRIRWKIIRVMVISFISLFSISQLIFLTYFSHQQAPFEQLETGVITRDTSDWNVDTILKEFKEWQTQKEDSLNLVIIPQHIFTRGFFEYYASIGELDKMRIYEFMPCARIGSDCLHNYTKYFCLLEDADLILTGNLSYYDRLGPELLDKYPTFDSKVVATKLYYLVPPPYNMPFMVWDVAALHAAFDRINHKLILLREIDMPMNSGRVFIYALNKSQEMSPECSDSRWGQLLST